MKCQEKHGMKSLNCLMDLIPCEILKIIFITSSRSMNNKTPVKICVNKIQHRITLNTKCRYYLELLIPESMKLLGNTKEKITEDRNGGNASHLEINEVVLLHCNILNNKSLYVHVHVCYK